MRIAVVKESDMSERRVALTPDVVGRLVKQGHEVWVQAGAGDRACFPDATYTAAGATIIESAEQVWREGGVILKVGAFGDRGDGPNELDWLTAGSTLIGFLNPLGEPQRIQTLANKGVTALAMELVPRSTRAQSADALSSQANAGGYKAVLIGAMALPKFFPMLTTAAGTIPPAKVMVLGVGVAGLQAIATARRLGAVVEAFDIRPETKEQVLSLGAKFIDVELEEDTRAEGGYAKEVSEESKRKTQEVLAERIAAADVVITTAQVPGKKAPILVTEAMVQGMKPGSVVVDMAAEQGGNCACTQPGKDVQVNGVTVIGPINLPSSMAIDTSKSYAKNLQTLLGYVIDKEGNFDLNLDDDIVDATCVAHGGEIRCDRVKSALAALGTPVG
jgi:NAD(P) transhydrogenase subunit alpha